LSCGEKKISILYHLLHILYYLSNVRRWSLQISFHSLTEWQWVWVLSLGQGHPMIFFWINDQFLCISFLVQLVFNQSISLGKYRNHICRSNHLTGSVWIMKFELESSEKVKVSFESLILIEVKFLISIRNRILLNFTFVPLFAEDASWKLQTFSM
jgi:hypothetical protein